MIRFTLVSRSWCHLCDDMLAALRAFPVGEAHEIDVVDVDADPTLLDRYDELVPVLLGRRAGDAETEICHYHLDGGALERFLAA